MKFAPLARCPGVAGAPCGALVEPGRRCALCRQLRAGEPSPRPKRAHPSAVGPAGTEAGVAGGRATRLRRKLHPQNPNQTRGAT